MVNLNLRRLSILFSLVFTSFIPINAYGLTLRFILTDETTFEFTKDKNDDGRITLMAFRELEDINKKAFNDLNKLFFLSPVGSDGVDTFILKAVEEEVRIEDNQIFMEDVLSLQNLNIKRKTDVKLLKIEFEEEFFEPPAGNLMGTIKLNASFNHPTDVEGTKIDFIGEVAGQKIEKLSYQVPVTPPPPPPEQREPRTSDQYNMEKKVRLKGISGNRLMKGIIDLDFNAVGTGVTLRNATVIAPEPLTIIASGLAVGLGTLCQREYSKKRRKK